MADYTKPLHDPRKPGFLKRKEGIHRHGLEYWAEKHRAEGYIHLDDEGRRKIFKADLRGEHIDGVIDLLSHYESLGAKYKEFRREIEDSEGKLRRTGHKGLADYLRNVAENVEANDFKGLEDPNEFYSQLATVGRNFGIDVKAEWQKAQKNTEEGKAARKKLSILLAQWTELKLKNTLFDNLVRDINAQDLDAVNSYKLAVATAAQYLSRGEYFPDLSRIISLEEANEELKYALRYLETKELPHVEREERSSTHKRKKGELK